MVALTIGCLALLILQRRAISRLSRAREIAEVRAARAEWLNRATMRTLDASENALRHEGSRI